MRESWIETFLSLIKTKNVTETANQLFLSQSTISSRLSQLEEYLQVTLFIRNKGLQHMILTKEGINFVPLAIDFKNLLKKMTNMKFNDYVFPISIAATNSIIDTFLSDFVLHIKKITELNYCIQTITEHSNKIYDSVSQNIIDIGLTTKLLQYPNLVTEKLIELPLYLIKSKDNPTTDCQLKLCDHIYIPWCYDVDVWLKTNFPEEIFPYMKTDSALHCFHMLSDNKWFFSPSTYFNIFSNMIDYSYSKNDKYPKYKVYIVYDEKKLEANELLQNIVNCIKSFSIEFHTQHIIE